MNVPEVTDCVQVDRDLHVNCFTRVYLYLYHSGFVTKRTVILREKGWCKTSILFNILEELKELKFKEKNIFSSNIIRYSLLLRYTSLQTHQLSMKEFSFPSSWCCEMCQIFKIARGDFERCSIDVWWNVLTEMWRILWWLNNQCKWKNWVL